MRLYVRSLDPLASFFGFILSLVLARSSFALYALSILRLGSCFLLASCCRCPVANCIVHSFVLSVQLGIEAPLLWMLNEDCAGSLACLRACFLGFVLVACTGKRYPFAAKYCHVVFLGSRVLGIPALRSIENSDTWIGI